MLSESNVLYLFLGGTGAGMCAVLSVLSLLSLLSFVSPVAEGKGAPAGGFRRTLAPAPRHRRLLGFGFLAAAVVLALACACLVFDMRRPDAAVALILRPVLNVTSIGAYSLGASVVASVFLGLCWLSFWRPPRAVVCAASALAVAIAVVAAGYTGVLLGSFATAPFWRTPLLPALFLASSLSCGIAGTVCSAVVFRVWEAFEGELGSLLRASRAVVVLEAALLASFVAWAAKWYPAYGLRLVSGDLAQVFWAGLVGTGLVLPLALNLLRGRLPGLRIHPGAVALLVLLGGFLLRRCVVAPS